MNTAAKSQSFDDLEGMLRLAVEQIASAPPPVEVAERVLGRAAKWEGATVRAPVKTKTRLYLAAGATLALVVLVAITIALVGGLPPEKTIAVPPQVKRTEPENNTEPKNKTEPQENSTNAAPGIFPAFGMAPKAGVPPAPAGASPAMRLGAQPFGRSAGLGGSGGFGVGGGVPSKRGGASASREEQAGKTDQERLVGNWFIVNDDSKRKGEMWVISEDRILMNPQYGGAIAHLFLHRLDAGKDPTRIDITVTKVNGPTVGVIKGIYILDGDELRLCLGDMGKDRPAAFPKKPGPGEVLILQRVTPSGAGRKAKEEPPAAKKEEKESQEKPAQDEKLRALIDEVLASHGREDTLSKLQFTMTVKHSNGETQHYFVQPPKNFRWETTHPDRTGKRIVILFPEGRRWWTKEPGGAASEFRPTGAEPKMEFWLDYVKFFGPRQVLRLKDPDHKVTLLDEEAKIGDVAAVGVQVTGPHYDHKMYFDKETHLLLKGLASDIVREVTFSHYKKFDAVPIAQKEHDGHFDPEVTDFKAVDKFDAKLFEQP